MTDTHSRPLRVLVILGHPRPDSLCGALAAAYIEGAARAGADIRSLDLAELSFAPDVAAASPEHQPLEPDLQRAYDELDRADHLVFVYPTWWGTMPALLKGFLDRLVMPGFAFRFYGPGATEWQGLWSDKSAQLITTMDTPPPVYNWLFRAPGTHAMRNATLGFCGVRPVHALVCGSVRTSDTDQRWRWIEQARRAGFALHSGVRTPADRLGQRVRPWLAALRLQFYPMTWAAYSVGALAGAAAGLDWPAYLFGYLMLFCLEAATVFCNERYDFDSDRINRNHGPFTGGSRVLPDAALDDRKLRLATGLMLIVAAVAGGLAITTTARPWAAAVGMLIALPLTLGYTVPPLKLSYRGLGELDVALTHSALVLALGAVLQGAALGNATIWLLALPLGLAILPAIILAGIPDAEADRQVGKQTLAVRFGNAGALGLAAAALILSALLALVFDRAHIGDGAFTHLAFFALPHAGLVLGLIWRAHVQGAARLERIDSLLVAALTYMLWFIAVPWIHLL